MICKVTEDMFGNDFGSLPFQGLGKNEGRDKRPTGTLPATVQGRIIGTWEPKDVGRLREWYGCRHFAVSHES